MMQPLQCSCGKPVYTGVVGATSCLDCWKSSIMENCNEAVSWFYGIAAYCEGHRDATHLYTSTAPSYKIELSLGYAPIRSTYYINWNAMPRNDKGYIWSTSRQYRQPIGYSSYLYDNSTPVELISFSFDYLFRQLVKLQSNRWAVIKNAVHTCSMCGKHFQEGELKKPFTCFSCTEKYPKIRQIEKAPANSGYVYLIQSPTGAYKIGCARDINKRLQTFEVKLPFEVGFIHAIQSPVYKKIERDLHSRFAKKRINGEWFNLSDDDVRYIKSL